MQSVSTLSLIMITLISVLSSPSFCKEASFQFYAVSDLQRVFEDGYRPLPAKDTIELFGIKNETLSAQCVIQAEQDLENVTVHIDPISHADESYTLPMDCIQWNFVGSIFIETNTSKLIKSDLIRPAPAHFPDYLAEDRQIAMIQGTSKAVYLTMNVPQNAKAGDYKGTVAVKTNQGNRSLPVMLTVYPFTLPEERHLFATKWYTTSKFEQFHGIQDSDSELFYDMLSVYAENMAAHRQNVFRLSLGLISNSRDAQDRYSFDFSKFDRWADIFWDTGGMDLLETGFVARFGEGGWSSHEIMLREFPVFDEANKKVVRVPGEEFLPEFLPALEDHLEEKGWLEKTVFHIADEPSNHNIMDWREASAFVHRHAPSLRRFDAIETTHCQDRLEVWIPKLDHLSTYYDAYREAQREGNELWFYTVGIYQGGSLPNKTVDVPLIDSRILHWLNYRYDLNGYLHWGYNHWTDDPFQSPGKHNGDGWQVYPTQNGLLNSLRWEQMRNGVQDYEYLWMLENKMQEMIQSLGDRLSILDPSRRSLEIATQVVDKFHVYTKDPAVLYAAKKQVIEEMMALDKKPRLIVQTNPIEHSAVAANCAVDLFGYVDPGSTIIVNGKELPVASDGLFMENIRLSKEHTIVVEAEYQNEKKRVVRSFEPLL